jgi:hypothetical protein
MTQRYAQIADSNTSREQPVFPVSARESFEREPRLVASKYHILGYEITRSGAIMLECRHFEFRPVLSRATDKSRMDITTGDKKRASKTN